MEIFKSFYRNPSVNELEELLKSTKLNDSNLYDFLTGYSLYLKKQKELDNF